MVRAFSTAAFAALVLCSAAFAQTPPGTLPEGCTWAAVKAADPNVDNACTQALSDANLAPNLHVEALQLRGQWHHRAGRYADATRDYDAALALAPQHAKLLRLRGWIHYTQNEFEDAHRLAQLSVETDPAQGQTYTLLAAIAEIDDDVDGAIAYYGKAVELDAKDVLSRYKRIRWLVNTNRAAQALADTEILMASPASDFSGVPLIELDWKRVPMPLAVRVMHGRALAKLGRYKDAEAFHDRITEAEPTPFMYAARSEFLYQLPTSPVMPSRTADAVASARTAVRLDATDAYAMTVLAYALEQARQYEEALTVSKTAFALETHPTLLARLQWQQGRLLRALGRSDEAAVVALKALEREPYSEITARIVTDLQKLGYLQIPEAGVTAEGLQAALNDAVTACMIDEKCGFL